MEAKLIKCKARTQFKKIIPLNSISDNEITIPNHLANRMNDSTVKGDFNSAIYTADGFKM